MAKEQYDQFKAEYDAGKRYPVGYGDPSTQNLPPNMGPTGDVSNLQPAKAATPEEMKAMEDDFRSQMRRPPGAQNDSPSLQALGVQIASNESEEAQIFKLEQELGIRGEDGSYQDQAAVQEHGALRDQSIDHIESLTQRKAPPAPAAPAEGAPPVPANERLGISKENTLFQMAGGIADSVQAVANLGITVSNMARKLVDSGAGQAQNLDFASEYFPESAHIGNSIARGAVQFMLPYASLGMATKGAAVASVGSRLATGLAVDFMGFQGHTANLNNLIQSYPSLANPISSFLASKPKDGEIEGRLKNAITGLGLGALGEGVFAGVKMIKESNAAKTAIEEARKIQTGEVKPPVKGVLPEGIVEATPLTEEEIKAGAPGAGDATAKMDKGAASTGAGGIEKPAQPTIKDVAQNQPTPIVEPADILKPNGEIDKGGGYKINLTKIDANTDTISVIKNMADSDKPRIEAMLGDPRRHEELVNLANRSGITVDSILGKSASSAMNDVELFVLRSAEVNSAEELRAIALKASASDDPKVLAEFMDKTNNFATLNRAVVLGKSRAAQALGSLKASVGGESSKGLSEGMMQMIDLYGQDNVKLLSHMISEMPPRSIIQATEKTLTRRIFDAVQESYVGNLLSGLNTVTKTFIGSPTMYAQSVAAKFLAPIFNAGKNLAGEDITKMLAERESLLSTRSTGSFDQMIKADARIQQLNTKLGEVVHMGGIEVGEGVQSILGFFDGTKETIQAVFGKHPSGKSLGELGNEIGGRTYEREAALSGKSLIPTAYDADGNLAATGATKMFAKGFDLLGKIPAIPLGFHGAFYDFWKIAFNRAEVNTVAYRLGVKQGLTGDALGAFMQKTIANPPSFVSAEGKMFAQFNTFNNPLEGVAQKFKELTNTDWMGAPILKMAFPFTHIPTNIVLATLDNTPIGAAGVIASELKIPILKDMAARYNSVISAGGAPAQMLKARVALGNTAFAIAGLYAGQGVITGSGPLESSKRKLLEATGWQPNSVVIGKTHIPLWSLGPMGSAMGIAADVADIARHATDTKLDIDPAHVAAVLSYTALEKSLPEGFVQNLSNLIESIQNQDASALQKMMVNTIPGIGMVNTARKISDPVVRNTSVDPNIHGVHAEFVGLINHLKDQIPGLSSSLPPNRNIFGDQISIPAPFGAENITAFFGDKPHKNDFLAKELVRLGYYGPFRKAEGPEGETYLDLNMPPKTIHDHNLNAPAHVDLTPKQYDRFVRLSAGFGLDNEPSAYGGGTLRDAMKYAVGNYDSFGAQTDQQKRILLKKVVTEYRKSAESQMLHESDDIQTKLDKSRNSSLKARGINNL